MTDTPLVEVTIAAPYATVWKALRDPALLARWFGWDAESLDAEIKFIFEDSATADEATGIVQFGEWEGNSDRFEVIDQGDHTVVRIVRAGAAPDGGWDEIFGDVVQGWIAFAQQLKFAVEHHGLAARRTLFLSGEPKEGQPLGRAALALDAPESIDSPSGALTGHTWHAGRHQTGVAVDQWGGGLLVAMDQPPGGKRPRGVASLILTTYGLDETAFADFEAKWRGWWDARYDKVSSQQGG